MCHKNNFSDKANNLLLSHICALYIFNVSFCQLFFPSRFEETHKIFPHICEFLPDSFNPIHQGAYGLDYNFLLLWLYINVNIKMYIFDHLRMYIFAILPLDRYIFLSDKIFL